MFSYCFNNIKVIPKSERCFGFAPADSDAEQHLFIMFQKALSSLYRKQLDRLNGINDFECDKMYNKLIMLSFWDVSNLCIANLGIFAMEETVYFIM